MVDFFNKFYWLQMKICAKEARRLKSKIEFRTLMEKMKKRFWSSWRNTKSTDIWRNGVGFGRRISRLEKALKWNIYYFIYFFCANDDVGRFLFNIIGFRPGTHSFRGFFGLSYSKKRIFEPTILLLKKAARCQAFLAVVSCLFHNHLRLKRSSLLNVYVNYKFEISLLTSPLFFSLFNLISCWSSMEIKTYLWLVTISLSVLLFIDRPQK